MNGAGEGHPFESLDRLRRRLARFAPRRLEGDRRAAVAVIFRPGPEGVEVLLIHRAEHPKDPWSGHIAFPGGRMDPEDESALAAAVRESDEEIGLDLGTEAVHLGRFSDLQAVARGRRLGLIIEPFAFELRGSASLACNHEVQEAFWLPLSFLTDWSHRSWLEHTIDGRIVRLPCYSWEGKVLWGLTLRILDEVIEILTGKTPADWPSEMTTGSRNSAG